MDIAKMYNIDDPVFTSLCRYYQSICNAEVNFKLLNGDAAKVLPRLYDSHTISVHIRKGLDNTFYLYFPVGLLVRVYLLATIFLNKSDDFSLAEQRIIYSPRDQHSEKPYIPKSLDIVFSSKGSSDLSRARSLLNKYVFENKRPDHVYQAVAFILDFVLLHEDAHIAHYHFQMKNILEETEKFPLHDSVLGGNWKEILEGFEVAADSSASQNIAQKMMKGIYSNSMNGEHISNMFFALSLGLCSFVSLSDFHNRSFDMPGSTEYPHPQVRLNLISQAIIGELGNTLGPLFKEILESVSGLFSSYINRLVDLETLVDLELGLASPEIRVPICPLNYDPSGFGESVLKDYCFRSFERGKRTLYLGEMLGLYSLPTSFGSLHKSFNLSSIRRLANAYARAEHIKVN